MVRIERLLIPLLGLLLLSCGGSSTPPVATGQWRAVLTGAAAQAGQSGEQASFTLSLTQDNSKLGGAVLSLVEPSNCLPSSPSIAGAALNGQVRLPGGEAAANLQLNIQLPSGKFATLDMTGAMQSDANSAAGLYKLNLIPAGCSSAQGTFTLTRLPKA